MDRKTDTIQFTCDAGSDEDLYSNYVREILNVIYKAASVMILVLEPFCDSLTSSCAHNMEIQCK